MRGLYLINSLEGGGAEKVFCRLISLKKNTDNNTLVVILDDLPDAYTLPADVTTVRLGANKNAFLSFFRFISLARKYKPDYTVSFLTRANLYNVIGRFFSGYKAIISERSHTMGRLGHGRFAAFKIAYVKLVYALADAIIAVSNGVKEGLEEDFGVPEKKILILNNPVDLPAITSSENTSHKAPILAMGRLVKSKGFESLLEAYAESAVDRPLIILGQGPGLDSLESLALTLNVKHKVSFPGYQANPKEYLSKSSYFILSSRLEGFPNALLEAMSLGKAVIATDCQNGPREILELGDDIRGGKFSYAENGLMVRVDDVQAMAAAIQKLNVDHELRKSLASKAKKRVERYNPENFIANYSRIIKGIVGQ